MFGVTTSLYFRSLLLYDVAIDVHDDDDDDDDGVVVVVVVVVVVTGNIELHAQIVWRDHFALLPISFAL